MGVEWRGGQLVYVRAGEPLFTWAEFRDSMARNVTQKSFGERYGVRPSVVAMWERKFLEFGARSGYKLIEGDGMDGVKNPYGRRKRQLKFRARMKALRDCYESGGKMDDCLAVLGTKDRSSLIRWLEDSGCKKRNGPWWFGRGGSIIEERVREMYGKHKTSEIAAKCGISESQVNRLTYLMGLRDMAVVSDRVKLVRRRLEEGKTQREVELELGVDAGTVSRVARRLRYEQEAAQDEADLSAEREATDDSGLEPEDEE